MSRPTPLKPPAQGGANPRTPPAEGALHPVAEDGARSALEAARGLTSAQAAARTAQGQANRAPKAADGGVAAIVRRNLFTLFNLLNCMLAALLLWVGSYRNLLFMGVVVSNAVIGLVQELRAKRMHDRLLLLAQGQVSTLRDGEEIALLPEQLVLGDVIRLSRGDQTPADARVLTGNAELNEALLTGESEASPKQAGDLLLSGSYVTEGAVTAELTAVGIHSFAGQLQHNARRLRRPVSALMASLATIIRVVSIAIVPMGLLLYGKQTELLGLSVPAAVTKTVAATLGMIPEGLVLLTSMALAVGVLRLGRQKALVNELYGIENLARVDVLCLDKTGTLTGGHMALADVLPLEGTANWDITNALRAFAFAFPAEPGTTQAALSKEFPPATGELPLATVPFSSERKWSAASFASLGTLVLGAPERTALGQAEVLAQARVQAAKGYRVLCLLRTRAPLAGKTLPEGLSPLALLLLKDPIRPDAAATLRYFHEQGVAVKVLSGDSSLTVSRIAAEVGLRGAHRAVDCAALAHPLPYDDLVRHYNVFGRVSPDDKRELVAALKRQGHTVAMIGDGVNDVPALKAADCSIVMAGGSDAAARVAQITLLNADFSVLPSIVLEGRRVINNITRASALFLVKNLFSFLLSLLLLALPFAYPFAPIQLTLVSSLTIGFPSFVLALQPNRERVTGNFLKNVVLRALPGGAAVAVSCLAAMLAGRLLGVSEPVVSTVCTLVAAFVGLSVLLLTCLPLDALRRTLTLSMTVAMALCILLFPELFYLTPLDGPALWTLLCALAVALVLLLPLTWLLTRTHTNPQPRQPDAPEEKR